jgi:hypothetical protein
MKINVTQKDIDLAVTKRDVCSDYNCLTDCLIATVLKRRSIKFETVGITMVWNNNNDYILLPEEVCNKIRDFIERNPISPFSFTVNVDPTTKELIL